MFELFSKSVEFLKNFEKTALFIFELFSSFLFASKGGVCVVEK